MKELPKDISNELKKFMEPDENLVDFRSEPWSFYKRRRWAILTSKRLYLIKKIFFGVSFDVVQIILPEATFEMLEGILLDTVYIRESAGEHIVNFLPTKRESTIKFFRQLEKTREGEPEGNVEAQAELEALAKVFYEKHISKKEYENKKKEILDKL
ncbi:hypothetical protein C4544_07075 [candidate division WS5 bacterium]|uniref:YokE-like PH domain-containing protein n=1 Tax=candidate division WS5 bacterium TaxID=2093353 RepID=A0A419DAG8_9BACT|nr:MAG: hypothetical protein C4544_07075 [candidate division WS5 bacterium]